MVEVNIRSNFLYQFQRLIHQNAQNKCDILSVQEVGTNFIK